MSCAVVQRERSAADVRDGFKKHAIFHWYASKTKKQGALAKNRQNLFVEM